jgi:hypothetical protein
MRGRRRAVSCRLMRGVVWLAVFRGVGMLAQTAACPPPTPYKYLRYDEDYSYLRDPVCRTDPFDKLKFVPLNSAGDVYLSFSGETRQTVEYFHNALWGQGPQGPAYSLQRYMGSVDFHWNKRLRFYGQMKSGLEFGRAGGPRVFDEDKLAVNQAFVDIGSRSLHEAPSLCGQAGRNLLMERRAGFRCGKALRFISLSMQCGSF